MALTSFKVGVLDGSVLFEGDASDFKTANDLRMALPPRYDFIGITDHGNEPLCEILEGTSDRQIIAFAPRFDGCFFTARFCVEPGGYAGNGSACTRLLGLVIDADLSFRLCILRGDHRTDHFHFKRRIMFNAGPLANQGEEFSGRAPDGYGSFRFNTPASIVVGFNTPASIAVSRKLPAEVVKEAFLKTVNSSTDQSVEWSCSEHVFALLRELGDDNVDESLKELGHSFNAPLSLDDFLKLYFEGAKIDTTIGTFESYWCDKYGRGSFIRVVKMGLLLVDGIVDARGVPIKLHLLPDSQMSKFQSEGDFVAAAKASREADEAAKIAAQRAQAEAEGKYYPCVKDVVLYSGEPTKCNGKNLVQGTQGTVVDITSEGIRVRWTGIGPMACNASVLKFHE